MSTPAQRATATTVLVTMTLANALILADQTAVPLTLPAIDHQFGVSTSSAQWVMTVSLLPLAGFLVLGGRLGDSLGRRQVFLTGAVMFGVAALVGGLAPTFGVLLAARAFEGFAGALMLPATIAIVSASVTPHEQGRTLGMMAGTSAVAAALGPTIGGILTSALTWRAVLLVCVPLLVVVVILTLRAVAPDDPDIVFNPHIDITGALLLFVVLVSVVFGLTQTHNHSVRSELVTVPAILAVLSGVAFVRREQRATDPLMSFGLLGSYPNYLASTISQALAGAIGIGLGVIFPLILILNLEMSPVKAGFALLPTTLPMVILGPAVGRWYDRAGSRIPMITGFAGLAASGLLLAVGINDPSYLSLLPGLLLYGVALSIVLTVNDPVDSVPHQRQGEAAGVQATAEQAGGAVGIAALYAVFHGVYQHDLRSRIDASPLHDLTSHGYANFEAALLATERTGLDPRRFDPAFLRYLGIASEASQHGYTAVFISVIVLSGIGILTAFRIVSP